MTTTNTQALMEKLFRWKNKVTISGIDFYVRVVSDQIVDDARREALLESRKLRRDLRNTESEDYLIYIDPLHDLDDDQLRTLITSNAMREVMQEYLNSNPRPIMPQLGDNPTQEEQEEQEAFKEQRDAEYLAEMTSYVENWQKDFLAGLEKRDRDMLFAMAQKLRTDQICEDKFSEIFEERVVAASVYTDDKYKTRMFTLEQYRELPTEIRQQLRDAYNGMSITPDNIKN
jgi:hypothetical protein